MPETFGKRQRKDVKARKAAAREERRVARNQRRAPRESSASRGWPILPITKRSAHGPSVTGASQIECNRGFGAQFATSGSLEPAMSRRPGEQQ
jgi:hypothetical protein